MRNNNIQLAQFKRDQADRTGDGMVNKNGWTAYNNDPTKSARGWADNGVYNASSVEIPVHRRDSEFKGLNKEDDQYDDYQDDIDEFNGSFNNERRQNKLTRLVKKIGATAVLGIALASGISGLNTAANNIDGRPEAAVTDSGHDVTIAKGETLYDQAYVPKAQEVNEKYGTHYTADDAADWYDEVNQDVDKSKPVTPGETFNEPEVTPNK